MDPLSAELGGAAVAAGAPGIAAATELSTLGTEASTISATHVPELAMPEIQATLPVAIEADLNQILTTPDASLADVNDSIHELANLPETTSPNALDAEGAQADAYVPDEVDRISEAGDLKNEKAEDLVEALDQELKGETLTEQPDNGSVPPSAEMQDAQASDREAILRAKAQDGKITAEEAKELNQLNQDAQNDKDLNNLNTKTASGEALSEADMLKRDRLQELQDEKTAAQNDKDQAVETSAQPNSEPQLTREQHEAEVKAHNDRDAKLGKIDQEEADRRTAEAMEKYDAEHPQTEGKEETTEGLTARLDTELTDAQKKYIEGDLTADELQIIIENNRKEREEKVNKLVKRMNEGDKSLTPFEREVAKTADQMVGIFVVISKKSEMLQKMEDDMAEMKSDFSKAENFKINTENPNDPKNQENIQKRHYLSNKIARQARFMADFSEQIVKVDINEFLSLNNKLDSMVGDRGIWRYLVVKIGTDLQRKANKLNINARTAQIAKSGKF